MPTITPPFTVPSGQTCIFALPTMFSGTGYNSGGCIGGSWSGIGVATLSGGTVAVSGSCLVGPGEVVNIEWSDFSVPQWPPGTVIHNIYPVIYVDSFESGAAADIWMSINGSGYGTSPTISGTGQLSVANSSDSIGNTASVITSATVGIPIDDSDVHLGPDNVVVTYIGLAVYVTLQKLTDSVCINVGNTKTLGS